MRFLSERNIEMHKEYLNTLILKYNVFLKSYPELTGRDVKGIFKTRIPRRERAEAEKLYSEIVAHKLYFSSFSDRNISSERIKKEYGSVASFLYFIAEECKKADKGFLFICDDGKSLSAFAAEYSEDILRTKNAVLALDLCEHAYFYDYGFDKESYILNAISHFDLRKIEKSAN